MKTKTSKRGNGKYADLQTRRRQLRQTVCHGFENMKIRRRVKQVALNPCSSRRCRVDYCGKGGAQLRSGIEKF